MKRNRAVIYARQSLDRAGEGAAVARQIAECRALAEARGWDVVEELIDNDVSASTGVARPAYSTLLDRIRSGATDYVIVWHMDRLTRRIIDLEDVIAVTETSGIKFATVTGDVDLSTDTGRLMARVMASFARAEVERKSARQRAANRQRASQGVARWLRRPFGYDRGADGAVVIVDAEAQAIREGAAAVLGGASLASVARDWNERGLLTTGGVPWRNGYVRRVFLNPRHAGRNVYLGDDVGEGDWTAILDDETHQRLVELLTDPSRRSTRSNAAKHLLSGIARCGVCDAPLKGAGASSGERRWSVYRCPEYHLTRKCAVVDVAVTDALLARMSAPDAAALLAPVGVDVDALRADYDERRHRRDDLAALLAEGLLGADAVREQSERLTAEMDDIARRVSATTGTHPAFALTGGDASAVWNSMDLAQRRDAVRSVMVPRVVVIGRGSVKGGAANDDPRRHVDIDWTI
ncbi:recombinase family protein [Cellulosimicrobium sp. NPDC055967]|uniref:recombinase family protein n=1 Tax=Cellulosimicrobium sp. NPDC055967 TaxID=3345670 RepID=UPI0035DFBE2D